MPDTELILAATDALARSLREDHALAQRDAGRRVWRTPRILSLDQWVADLWTGTWPAEQLISHTQALVLWLNAIQDDRDLQLLAPLATAREALRAERLALLWDLDTAALPAWNAEQRAWQRWRRTVRTAMRQHGWLLREDLYAHAGVALEDGAVRVPEHIELHGFNTALPRAAATFVAGLARCTHVESGPSPAVSTPDLRYLRVADSAQQWRHVAATLRMLLAAAGDGVAPRITVAVPDLETQRPALEAALTACVAPLAGTPQRRPPWRWDSGRAALAWPWIDAADAVFGLDARGMDGPTVTRLLLATPLWSAPERAAAAELDYRLRDARELSIALETLCRFARGTLKTRLRRLTTAVAQEPRTALPSAWAERFTLRLEALEWPAAGVLSSVPFQCLNELRRRLGRLAGMDTMLGRIDLASARRWLRELLRAGFEPRVEYPQPVTLTTPEQAATLPCDVLMICGAAVDAFPGRRQPTPFLAPEAQRAAGIPEASPATWLDHAHAQAAALLQQAPHIQVLCIRLDDSGADVAPAPVFNATWEDAPLPATLGVAEQLAGSARPLPLPERDPVPPLSAVEQVRGDARLFEAWAEAPFLAFCTHRLGVTPLPHHARGLDARDQGTIIHAALQRLWGQLRTSAALAKLAESALDAEITQAMQPTAERVLSRYAFSHALQELETRRIFDLLRQWLRHERRRAEPFEVVEREIKLEAEFGGLALSLRIDRIDRVDTADGPRLLLLDYKTGREARPAGWKADSLKAPQLPLYAVVAPHTGAGIAHIDGIGFAHLKDGHPALSVACSWSESLLAEGVAPRQDWDAQLQSWAATLEACARGFVAGGAEFDPARWPAGSYNGWLLALAGQAGEDAGDPDPEAAP